MAEPTAPRTRASRRLKRSVWHRVRAFLLRATYELLFHFVLLLALPWLLLRFATSRRLRTRFTQRVGFVPTRRSAKPCVWIHGVSVGEVKAAGALARALRERFPEYEIAISATTQTGFAIARELYRDHLLFYYPLDLCWIVARVFRRIRPSWIVLVELEIWPNLLMRADRMGIPVVVINGRISERSWRGYRKLGQVVPELMHISYACAQNETYRERFLGLGVAQEHVAVTGNVKFDNLHARGAIEPDGALRELFGIAPDELVLVAGSTHPGEERAALAAVKAARALGQNLRLIVAPRHPQRLTEVMNDLRDHGGNPLRLTELRAAQARPQADATYVVDTIGELERVYTLAAIVFVGGSLFPKGGHNVLEPAALAKAVLFGPHTFNFAAETRLLLECGAARRVHSDAELTQAVCDLLADPAEAERMGRAGLDAIIENRGATARTIAAIEPILSQVPSRA